MTNIMSVKARRMRREKTEAERRLWWKLRALNRASSHFRQQAPIGGYIADFADHGAKLVIELDGSQHAEPSKAASDASRTEWLNSRGYRVLRFWNNAVLTNIDGVMTEIMVAAGMLRSEDGQPSPRQNAIPPPLRGRLGGGELQTFEEGVPPTPNPSPQGGGGSVAAVAAGMFLSAVLSLLVASPALAATGASGAVDPFVYRLMVFAMAIFVGYYVVWSVTPALHTPLMSVTNAISSVIVVGALLAVGVTLASTGGILAKIFGFLALVMASVNIVGGFLVTQRMLGMYKKKDAKK